MLLAITTTGKVVLILVAGTFIGFSLLVSMVIPRRLPEFPGRNLPVFLMTCVALFGAQIAAVVWVTGTQEVEAKAAETPAPPPATSTTSTAPATSAPAAEPGDAAAGKAVFTGSAGCKNCHTLKDAGATGSVGPNLDQKMPPYALVIDRVTHGKGVMPPFSGRLSKTDIENVAKYVSTVAGK